MAKGEIFTGLPKWAQGLIAVAIVGGVGFIGYKIYKKAQKNKLLEGSTSEVDKAKVEADKLNADPKTTQKITPAQMSIYANSLEQAFQGAGTDLPAIYKVFASMNNKADVLGLIKEYGTRKINSGIWLVPDFEGSLGSALTNELSNDEITALDMMLAKKGIGIKF
jgi:hypothetical protein